MAITLSSGRTVLAFDTIDSTNAEAHRRADGTRVCEPLWIVAAAQTQGRGRYGRMWESARGNLFATLLLPGPLPLQRAGQLSLVAGVAAADTIGRMVPKGRIAIKWPNDVLIGGRKVAGILLETCKTSDGNVDALALGIGINVVSHPDGTDTPATDLSEHAAGELTNAEVILDDLDGTFFRWLRLWSADGFQPIREAWLRYAWGKGEALLVRLPSETFEGVFDGLSPDGELVLRMKSGKVRRIAAADVYYREPSRERKPHAPGR